MQVTRITVQQVTINLINIKRHSQVVAAAKHAISEHFARRIDKK
ncbi:MAG: hypothetical protein ACRC37_06135 [Lentisphaeria bacterium]